MTRTSANAARYRMRSMTNVPCSGNWGLGKTVVNTSTRSLRLNESGKFSDPPCRRSVLAKVSGTVTYKMGQKCIRDLLLSLRPDQRTVNEQRSADRPQSV